MRKIKKDIDMKKLLLLAAVVIGLSACVSEDTDWGGQTPASENVGYLSFGDDSIQVFVEHEEGESDASHKSSTAFAPTTRAVDQDVLNDYTVQIIQDGEVKQTFEYGDWNNSQVVTNYKENHSIDENHTVTGIELPVGTYTVRVFSAETQNVNDTPEYEGSTEVTLTKGTVSHANVTCHLSSVKVTVTFDSILADVIDPTATSVMARLDEEGVDSRSAYTWSGYVNKEALTKGHDAVTATYLKPQAPTESGSMLNIYLTTIYGGTEDAGTGSQINNQKLQVGNVKAGEWRKVTVKLENGTAGTVYFVVTVETWVANEQIDMTQAVYAAMLGEAEIPDVTDAPVLETPVGGLDLTQALTLTEDMFTNGAYQGDASMTIKTKQPIKALYLSATSDSEGLPELISFMGLDAVAVEGGFAGLDLAGTMNAGVKALINTWGFPTANIAGQTELTFNIAGLLSQLQAEPTYTGNHSFSLTIVDAKENNATYTLNVTSGEVIDPNIVWEGYNINQRYTVDEGIKIKIIMTASAGIKNVIVTIEGKLAEPDGLNKIGMPNSFDLIDPGYMIDPETLEPTDEHLGPILEGMGFPVGDDVYGSMELSFDITSFMSMMGSFKGNNDFVVTLTDLNGQTITRKVMLTIE